VTVPLDLGRERAPSPSPLTETASDRLGHNLPSPRTRFMGRERELAQVETLLSTSALVTLTGAGGCGKTRLALEVAQRQISAFPGGAWFVDLAPVRRAEVVPSAVAAALRVGELDGQPLVDTLADHIAQRRVLIILDNCEHLVDACATLVEVLMRECPELAILATSREALRVTGEVRVAVRTLLIEEEAVPLFVDRARAAMADFELTSGNAEAVTTVCWRLDGIPLAIELAATWVTVMSPAELVGCLDDRFGLLSRGMRTAVARQRTLRAAVDWSHDMLSAAECALFRRLALFAGGFTLAAVEAVCGEDELSACDIRATLASLCDKSMVVADAEPSTPTRHRMLETLREYGLERLRAAGEEEAMRDRHLSHCIAMAEEIHASRMASGSDELLHLLSAERDNLRAALAWSRGRNPQAEMQLLGTLVEDVRRTLFGVGDIWQWLNEVLAGSSEPSVHRARAVLAAGNVALYQGADDRARQLLEESLHLYKRLHDASGVAWARLALGTAAWLRHDRAEALRQCEASWTAHTELGNRFGVERSQVRLAMVRGVDPATQGQAQEMLERGVALAHELGDSFGEGFAAGWLGWTILLSGHPGSDPEPPLRRAVAILGAGHDPIVFFAVEGLAWWRAGPTSSARCACTARLRRSAVREV
jgi:predicted ATPase